jgi:hypothetical protein
VVEASSAQSSVRSHDQGRASSGLDPSTVHANGMGSSIHALQPEHGWNMQISEAHVADENLNPASHPSTGVSNTDAIVDLTDDAAHDGSYGTLMLSEGGRSKYLGPTAGSEWLRDVCKTTVDIKKLLKCVSLKITMQQGRRLNFRLARQVQL